MGLETIMENYVGTTIFVDTQRRMMGEETVSSSWLTLPCGGRDPIQGYGFQSIAFSAL